MSCPRVGHDGATFDAIKSRPRIYSSQKILKYIHAIHTHTFYIPTMLCIVYLERDYETIIKTAYNSGRESLSLSRSCARKRKLKKKKNKYTNRRVSIAVKMSVPTILARVQRPKSRLGETRIDPITILADP